MNGGHRNSGKDASLTSTLQKLPGLQVIWLQSLGFTHLGLSPCKPHRGTGGGRCQERWQQYEQQQGGTRCGDGQGPQANL